jgi:hypothetical protein
MPQDKGDWYASLVLVAVALGAWAYFGDFQSTVANWFWPEEPAPWEQVDAIYLPDDAMKDLIRYDVGSLEGCRSWVYAQAASRGDPTLVHGNYVCAVGHVRSFMAIRRYRIRVR